MKERDVPVYEPGGYVTEPPRFRQFHKQTRSEAAARQGTLLQQAINFQKVRPTMLATYLNLLQNV